MGFFVAEGRRFYGQTTTSAVPNKAAMVVRQPLGVAGLIIAANTPIANVAWKAFPALLCGNAAILKAEDTPLSAWAFALLAREAGVPEAFTRRCTALGRRPARPLSSIRTLRWSASRARARSAAGFAETAGRRLAKTCLELGGKNPLIVCDDADLKNAVTWAIGSAFSNAGQALRGGQPVDCVRRRLRPLQDDARRRRPAA